MDLDKVIRELHQDRKSIAEEERRMVSKRMKKYWALAGLFWLLLDCLENKVEWRLGRSAEMGKAGFQEHTTQPPLTRLCSPAPGQPLAKVSSEYRRTSSRRKPSGRPGSDSPPAGRSRTARQAAARGLAVTIDAP
jgi:hypothetical protein